MRTRLWVLLLILCLALGGCLAGQVDPIGYTLSGQVMDHQGQGVAEVLLLIAGDTTKTVITDERGYFRAQVRGRVSVRPLLGESIFYPEEKVLLGKNEATDFLLQTKILAEGTPSITLDVQTLALCARHVQKVYVREIQGVGGVHQFALLSESNKGHSRAWSEPGYALGLFPARLVVVDSSQRVLASVAVPFGDYSRRLSLEVSEGVFEVLEGQEPVLGVSEEFLASGSLEKRQYVEESLPLFALGEALFPAGYILLQDIAVELSYAFSDPHHFNELLDRKFREVGYVYEKVSLYIQLPHDPLLVDAKTGEGMEGSKKNEILATITHLFDAEHTEGKPLLAPRARVSVEVEVRNATSFFRVVVHSVEGVEEALGFTLLVPENKAASFGTEMLEITQEDTMPLYILARNGSVLYTLFMQRIGEGSLVPCEGSHVYKEMERVVIRAIPSLDWEFRHWQGDVSEEDKYTPEWTMEVTGHKEITAVFTPYSYELTGFIQTALHTPVSQVEVQFDSYPSVFTDETGFFRAWVSGPLVVTPKKPGYTFVPPYQEASSSMNMDFFVMEPPKDLGYENTRSYSWFKSQFGTGPAWNSNCGPASTAMALHYEEGLDIPVAEIRDLNYRDGGWWYTSDIMEALAYYGASYNVKPFSLANLFASLDKGFNVILCINLTHITSNFDPFSRYHRYYAGGTGHFLVVKGYTQDKNWILIHDPFSDPVHHVYPSGSPMGKDRYYAASDLSTAALLWWPFLIQVGADQTSSLAPVDVPVMWGGNREGAF